MARIALALLAFAWVVSGIATVLSTFLTAKVIGAAERLWARKFRGFSRIRIWPISTQIYSR